MGVIENKVVAIFQKAKKKESRRKKLGGKKDVKMREVKRFSIKTPGKTDISPP